MRSHSILLPLLIILLPLLTACGEAVPTDPEEDLELFDGGYFTLLKPAGWDVSTAGMCSDIHIQTWDPDNPIRRVLHAGLIGSELVPISVALVVSTVLTIAVTAWLMAWLGPRALGADGGEGD